MTAKKIAVLLHEKDHTFDTTNYYLRLLMKEWQSNGYIVEVVRGVSRFVPADVIIPHIDLTVTPPEYREYLARYPLVINQQIVDISKSKISTNIVAKGDAYTGPVIVKTDRNYGGIPETILLKRSRLADSIPGRIIRKVVATLGGHRAAQPRWRSIEWLEPGDYPVFASLRDVPDSVFANKNLVVEKFLPEIEGDDYSLRCCFFLGANALAMLVRSKDKIVKGASIHRREEIDVPPEIHAIRRRMGFDYGKFDYVTRDGKVVLFDANRTPSFIPTSPLTPKITQLLAQGLMAMLNERA